MSTTIERKIVSTCLQVFNDAAVIALKVIKIRYFSNSLILVGICLSKVHIRINNNNRNNNKQEHCFGVSFVKLEQISPLAVVVLLLNLNR